MLICPSITQILGHIYSIVEADLYTIHEEMLTLVELHRMQKKCSVKWFWFSPYAFVSVSRGCFHLCLCSKSLHISSPLGCTFFTMQITYCTHPKGIKMSQRLLEAKKIQGPRRDSNPQSSDPKSDTLSIRPRGLIQVFLTHHLLFLLYYNKIKQKQSTCFPNHLNESVT